MFFASSARTALASARTAASYLTNSIRVFPLTTGHVFPLHHSTPDSSARCSTTGMLFTEHHERLSVIAGQSADQETARKWVGHDELVGPPVVAIQVPPERQLMPTKDDFIEHIRILRSRSARP